MVITKSQITDHKKIVIFVICDFCDWHQLSPLSPPHMEPAATLKHIDSSSDNSSTGRPAVAAARTTTPRQRHITAAAPQAAAGSYQLHNTELLASAQQRINSSSSGKQHQWISRQPCRTQSTRNNQPFRLW
jgi:hypothetical protein